MKNGLTLCVAMGLWLVTSCVLGFDATVSTESTTTGDVDIDVLDDPDGDQSTDVTDIGHDGDTSGDADAETPGDADADEPDDVTVDIDGGDRPDASAAPTVEVTEPAAGTYTLGDTIDVVWSTANADEVTLSLVAGTACPANDADLVVPLMASFASSNTAYAWELPDTLAAGEYRVRVRASTSALVSAEGCSPVFQLQQAAGCESLDCALQNRSCSRDLGVLACGPCVDGYADSDGVCVVVDCGTAPAAPANARLTGLTGTQYGELVNYRCDEGHTTSAEFGGPVDVSRRCGAAGAWESPSGACQPVRCGANPAPVPNASLQSVDRTTYGGQAIYSCESGYVVTGTGAPGYTLTCNATGSWGSEPTCELVDCGALTSPANGSVSTPGGTTFGATASYSCEAGYLLNGGSDTLTCSATGSWGTTPTCNEIDECASGRVCSAPNNVCTNLPGSWQCSCAVGFTGATVEGGDANCSLVPVGLGADCVADSQCPSDSWCSTVSGYRRCSPRLFSGAAHQMDFVFVPAGTFQQGTPGATNGQRPYTATISRNYFVSRTEVTQGQWKAATGATNPSDFQNTCCTSGNCLSTENANENGPVEWLDWYAALAYANWLSVNEGLSACYALSGCTDATSGWHDGAHSGCTGATFVGQACSGYRLLTESEWERAARGSTTSSFYWGDTTDTATVGLYAWFSDNAGSRTQAVGGKQANAFGLHDMSGNVWEWVWDWVHTFPAFIDYPIGSATDYVGASAGSGRGVRGGSWFGDASLLRSSTRGTVGPSNGANDVGFRLARTALVGGDCGAPPPIINGTRTFTTTTAGSVASYSCSTGYTRSGAPSLTCSATGSWGTAPTCADTVDGDCGTPPTVTNGTRTYTTTTAGSAASYSCNSGYTRSGSAMLTCSATNSWGTAPRCTDTNECTEAGSVCTAANNVCTNTEGSWQCSCDDGYPGSSVTGGNALCTSPRPGTLGAVCANDSECSSNGWCSTVSGYGRCSPRVFSGAEHEMDFVFVPSVSSGYQQGTPCATNEERPYAATISRNYFVSRTEVTQGQWKAATGGTNSSYFQNTTCTNGSCSATENANDNGPVEQVDWYSTLAYANWLSATQGLSECYALSGCTDATSGWHDGAHSGCTGATFVGLACTGYRLLTESEWERAARGNTTSTYFWGEATDTVTVGTYAWFSGNADNRTQAVGGKQANAFGLHDMSGNVWEFVWDWYGYSYPSGSETDYAGPSSTSFRGFRGGSWSDDSRSLRSASRNGSDPSYRGRVVGFRLARTAN